MAVHIAILKREYLKQILQGTKTIESRMSRSRGLPHGRIQSGEWIYFKVSAGPFLARARAASVHDFAEVTPDQFADLESRFRDRVGGTDEYWRSKQASRFCTFIHLDQIEPIEVGPSYTPAHMRAWYVLEDAADPVHEVVLSDGAIRNRYVSLPWTDRSLRERAITLDFADGSSISTTFSGGSPRLSWRGWRTLFER